MTENGITYTYDLNGNLVTKTDSTGTTTYTYNYDGRLVEVQNPNGTITYQYDVDNNRITARTATGTTKYLVDTNRSLAQVLAEYTATGTTATYVYADDLISMTREAITYYYHFDGLGSTRLLTNASGAVTDAYDYDAFGSQIARTGTTVNEFLFTGQQYDANIGFYYLRARFYQPETGRFTSLDPFAGDPYAPMSLHKYSYAANDPVNMVDPNGEMVSLAIVSMCTSLMNSLSAIITPVSSNPFASKSNLDTVQPFLKLIRYAEHKRDDDGVYYVIFGGETFSDTSTHPNIKVTIGNYVSTAAGAYQIRYPTWKWAKERGVVTDFIPASQDKVALWLIKYRGAMPFIKAIDSKVTNNKFETAIGLLKSEWTSLPGGIQQGIDMPTAKKRFIMYMEAQ